MVMEENKSSQEQEAGATVLSTQNGRRNFLRKASAVALIATIPAKSVWATGLTNSIVASGHGSDMAGGKMNLQDVHFWTANENSVPDEKFAKIFGGAAIKRNGKTFNRNLTLRDIMTKEKHGDFKYKGPRKINMQLIAVYLNAHYSALGRYSIYFPVVGMGKPYHSAEAMAHDIYMQAAGIGGNPRKLARELDDLNSTKAAVI